MAPSQSMAPVLKRARFNVEDPTSGVPRPLQAVRVARFSVQSADPGEPKPLLTKLRTASPPSSGWLFNLSTPGAPRRLAATMVLFLQSKAIGNGFDSH